jgi:acyl-CoA reductase-like NAD-dependent aldehyde dehydrogenase
VSATVSKHLNLIGGEWVDASSGETMEVLNPSTGEVIAEVPRASAEDVDHAVHAAKKALVEWLETTPAERAEMLLKLADALDEHGDEIAELESLNVGKPLSSARDEIPVATDNIRFFAGAARVLEGKSAGEYMRGYTSWLRREPIGIVGGIAPWNYPLMMAIWKLAPALAAGNVQVLKPSEQTPLTTLRFAQFAADILPKYTNATGGEVYNELSQAAIDKTYARVIGDARNQYTLGYYSHAQPGVYRQLEVKVARAGLKVHAKDGFYPLPPARSAQP